MNLPNEIDKIIEIQMHHYHINNDRKQIKELFHRIITQFPHRIATLNLVLKQYPEYQKLFQSIIMLN